MYSRSRPPSRPPTLGMPRSRARTLSAVASAALADPTLFEAGNDLDVSVRRLRKSGESGNGRRSTSRCACASRTFPAADIGLIRALEALESRSYTAAELLERSAAWRPWRAYAAQQLWAQGAAG